MSALSATPQEPHMSNIIKTDLNNGATAETVDDASRSAHRVIDQAINAAHPAVENLGAGAHHTVDRLTAAATHTAEQIDRTGGQLRDAGSRMSNSVRTQLREQPIASLGIAVAAGFALSWLLRRN
jgi:ElaB/YqjD/DUF883 family membrane-anchored ribosome-binding protein